MTMIDYYNGGTMIDNSRLTEFTKDNLRHLSYEYKINIFDKNCSHCSFKRITVIDDRGRETEHKELSTAIDECLFNHKLHILRGCQYGGDIFTLDEIATNTCRLWYNETDEGGESEDNRQSSFTEIESIENRDIREVSISETISQ